MSFGKVVFNILRLIGNIITLGLYAWLKKKYGDKS